MQIFIGRNGQQYGPYSVHQINEFLVSGHVLPTDLAWHDGAPNWMPMTSLPGIQLPDNAQPTVAPNESQGASAPPVPPSVSAKPDAHRNSPINKKSLAAGAVCAALIAMWFSYRNNFSINCGSEEVLPVLADVVFKSESGRLAIVRGYQFAAATSTNQSLQNATQSILMASVYDPTGVILRKSIKAEFDAITTISENGARHMCQAMLHTRINDNDPQLSSLRFDTGLIRYSVQESDDGEHFTVTFTP